MKTKIPVEWFEVDKYPSIVVMYKLTTSGVGVSLQPVVDKNLYNRAFARYQRRLQNAKR